MNGTHLKGMDASWYQINRAIQHRTSLEQADERKRKGKAVKNSCIKTTVRTNILYAHRTFQKVTIILYGDKGSIRARERNKSKV
jgi:hypothetical protein